MACIGNMPSFKYVTVESLVITYNNIPYPIKTFVTNKKYIVWNIDRPYQLEDTNVRPNASLLEYLVVINDNGKPTIVEHEELLYSFNQTTNGSNLTSSTEYNALKSQVDKNTTKFNLVSNTVDDMTQIIGSTEELEDGSIIYNLNKVKSDSKSYGISIGEIQTKVDDKYAEIKPIILNDLVEYLRSVSEYKLSFTNILEDTLITDEELTLINTSKTNIVEKSTKLQTTLSNLKVIVDGINDTEKSQLVTDMKTKLSTLQNALITICDSYLQDSKISGEEKTNIIQKTYELATYIGTVQNTCSNITVNGQAGVIYSVENELLMLKDKTTSSIKELTRDTNGLTETVKGQTSEISQMKDSITSKVNSTEVSATIDDKLKDYSTTTQMGSAIDQKAGEILTTVGNTYLSQTDAVNTYATQSSVSQTSKDIVTRFSESGGYNIIKNGGFRNGLDSWWESGHLDDGTDKSFFVTDDNSEWVLDGTRALTMKSTNMTTGEYAVNSNKVKVKKNTNYTISYLVAAHRLTLMGHYVRGNDWNIIESQSYQPKSGSKDRNNWTKVVGTFNTGDNSEVWISFHHKITGEAAYSWITDVMINEGDLPFQWSPNPNELCDGIITANRDGIIVEMIDGEGSKGYSRMSYEGISTYDEWGNTKSWFSDDNAYIKELNVDIINNPYVVQSKPRVTNWYVAQTATGDGTGRDYYNKSNSINSVLEYIKNNYGVYSFRQNINIYCDDGMYLNENIYIGGWIGSGEINVLFGTNATFVGTILVEECTRHVFLAGNKTGFYNNDGCMWYRTDGITNGSSLVARNSSVSCFGFRVHSNYSTYGYPFATALNGGNISLYNNDIVKFWSICRISNNSIVYIHSNRGDVGTLCEYSDNGILVANSNLPICDSGKTPQNFYNSLGEWNGSDTMNSLWYPKSIPTPEEPTPTPQPDPPSKSWHWVEKTFYFNLSSTTEGSGSATASWVDKWGQGKWSNWQSHRGHAKPTESISSWCNVGSNTRNISMTLTMTRLSVSHGYTGAVPIPKIKQKDGSYWNSGVAFALGDKKSISLSSGIVSGLSDGTLSELTMWAGASTSDYSQYNGVSLKVKCEKYY